MAIKIRIKLYVCCSRSADNGDTLGEPEPGRMVNSQTATHLRELDLPDATIAKVPTAVSLIAAEDAANDDGSNDSDPDAREV